MYDLDPSLANFNFPRAVSTTFPNSNQVLTNDGGVACGGTMANDMLAQSCDPGYAQLGVRLALRFWLSRPISLPTTPARPSTFPTHGCPHQVFHRRQSSPLQNQALLGYSAIGQYNDEASALSNALVAAGVADGGTIMTPHVMEQITDSQGNVVTTYVPSKWMQAVSPTAAAQVTALMKQVAVSGTGAGVGFSPSLDVAVKTGTAQTGNPQGEY